MKQLYNLITCVEGQIEPHVASILKNVIYKFILHEEAELASAAADIARLLGRFCKCAHLMTLLLSHLDDSESKCVPNFIACCLSTLALFVGESSTMEDEHIERLLTLVVSSDYLLTDNTAVLQCTLRVANSIIKSAKSNCKNHQAKLFKILLQIGSMPSLAN